MIKKEFKMLHFYFYKKAILKFKYSKSISHY